MNVVAVVPASGKGLRMGKKLPKPYILLKGKPILIHTLKVLNASSLIDSIVVVANKSFIKKTKTLIKKYRLNKVKDVVCGGKRRSESVRNGLCAVGNNASIVLIHDGVRPFLRADLIKKSILTAKRFGACVCAVPVKPTIKQVYKDGFIKKTLNRQHIWGIQTPQVFKNSIIQKAYKKFRNIDATDDSMLVERLGRKVKLVMGSYRNIKITTPEDLIIAEAILKTQSAKRKA